MTEEELGRDVAPEEVEEVDEGGAEPEERPRGWTPETPSESVFVETGRGQTAEVQLGAPFAETIERIADEAHYGGYYRVFLNGEEILNPEEAPTTIESGMRIIITSYDKVG